MSSLCYLLFGITVVIQLCSVNAARVKIPTGRIVGGFETTIEDNPWQVSLQYNSRLHCGGSIIGSQWVLTASHCTNGELSNKFTVRVGSSAHASGGKVIKLKRYVQHPKYSSSTTNFDFSLLELAEPLTFNDKIQPIALPEVNSEILDGTLCRVSGWGNTNNSNETRDVLRAVNVPIINQEYCYQQYRQINSLVTPAMICTGYEEGGRGQCNGDSGGPLINENNGYPQLIGVVSWSKSMGCAHPKFPDVLARVTVARKWIESVTAI